jgi:hypothetical protein
MYPITDYVNFVHLSVTLTLKLGIQVLYMTHCLILVTICANLFKYPLIYEKDMERTQNIPYNRLS